MAPSTAPRRISPRTATPKASLEAIYDMVAALKPHPDAQAGRIEVPALGFITDIGQARLRLYARQSSSLPMPLLVVLVSWLMILFGGYGLLVLPTTPPS